MTIETANRLCAYRKNRGFSQEELAEKIGVSRQAVSKWERAEASPDIDTLILLAKIYGVTLDELLNTDPKNEATEEPTDGEAQDRVSLKNGIHVHSKDGDKVDISFKGIHVQDKNGDSVHIGPDEIKNVDGHIFYNEKNSRFLRIWHRIPWPLFCIIAYLLLGLYNLLGGWAYSWIIFLTIPLYYTLGSAISQRNPNHFAFPVLALIVYLVCGLYYNLWHPHWIIFAFVPLYYWICGFFKKEKNTL